MLDRSLLTGRGLHGADPIIPKQIYKDKELSVANMLKVNQLMMGGGMSQNWAAPYFFEYYINYHKFEYVVEIGSQKGALSLFLANMAAATEQFYFHTFEINKAQDWHNRSVEGVGHWFERIESISPFIQSFEADIFNPEVISYIKNNKGGLKTLIFADGGDKAREFCVYADCLQPGDCIVLHDWGREVFWSTIPPIENHGLVVDDPWACSCIALGTLLMPFRKL